MKKTLFLFIFVLIQQNIKAQDLNILDFIGNWEGIWTNTTFNSTGPLTMTFTADTTNKTAQMIIDLNGNVLGGGDPAPMTLNGTYNDTQLIVFAPTTATFGDFTLSVDNNGIVSGSAVNVPNVLVDNVTFDGTATSDTIRINYIMTFSALGGGGTANGVLLFYDKVTLGVNDINSTKIINEFKLEQNYPNPFNPTTSIIFEIPKDSNVNLTIYDLTGRKIRELINQSMSLGGYSVIWDGKDEVGNSVSGGIYLYNVKTSNKSLTKKMILMK